MVHQDRSDACHRLVKPYDYRYQTLLPHYLAINLGGDLNHYFESSLFGYPGLWISATQTLVIPDPLDITIE